MLDVWQSGLSSQPPCADVRADVLREAISIVGKLQLQLPLPPCPLSPSSPFVSLRRSYCQMAIVWDDKIPFLRIIVNEAVGRRTKKKTKQQTGRLGSASANGPRRLSCSQPLPLTSRQYFYPSPHSTVPSRSIIFLQNRPDSHRLLKPSGHAGLVWLPCSST